MGKRRHTEAGDVVLVYLEEKPATFARVEEIRPHPRPGWFFCDLLVLGVPPQPVTWILEREQIDGTGFTMGGRPVRLEALGELGVRHAQAREAEASSAGAAPGELATPAEEPALGAAPTPAGAPLAPSDERPKPRGGNVVKLVPRRS